MEILLDVARELQPINDTEKSHLKHQTAIFQRPLLKKEKKKKTAAICTCAYSVRNQGAEDLEVRPNTKAQDIEVINNDDFKGKHLNPETRSKAIIKRGQIIA